MFYLSEFFQILKLNKFLGFILFTGMFGVFSISHFEKEIKGQLSLDTKVKDTPYFNALIRKNLNIESVKRRMSKLPGVLAVAENRKKSLEKEIFHLKKIFGDDVINGLASKNYKKLKVELEKGIKLKSFILIKEYLSRLVGKDSITIGQMKRPKSLKLNQKDSLYIFLKWIDSYAILVFFFLWFIALVFLLRPVLKRTYIIEKFQRKSYVGPKIILSGMISFFVVILFGHYCVQAKLNELTLILALVMIVVTVGFCSILRRSKKYIYGF